MPSDRYEKQWGFCLVGNNWNSSLPAASRIDYQKAESFWCIGSL